MEEIKRENSEELFKQNRPGVFSSVTVKGVLYYGPGASEEENRTYSEYMQDLGRCLRNFSK